MKFYSDSKNLIVWDAEKSRALCTFKNGELETSDKRTIDILTESGYQSDSEVIEVTTHGDAEPQFIESNVDELRQEAKEKGLKGYHNMKLETLIDRLRG